ncbi:MAG: LysE family transporter [Pseudomonadota bacterium]|nr:LysE family transporter [Pseudomonadota bacterium]
MSLDLWLVYVLAGIALSLTPGPNGLLSLDHGVRHGTGRAVFTALGSVTGMSILIGASLAGLGAVMLTSETVFTVVKWVGAAYLVWLGVRLWRTRGFAVTAAVPDGPARRRIARHRAFAQGLVVALSNPKALIFFATFLPQFMQPDVPLWQQFVVLAGTYAAIEFAYEVMLAGAAGRLAPWLERHARTFNRVTGGAFIAVGAMVAASQR